MAADEATSADALSTKRHARAMRYTEQLLEQLVLEEHADRLAQQAETGDGETDNVVENINKYNNSNNQLNQNENERDEN